MDAKADAKADSEAKESKEMVDMKSESKDNGIVEEEGEETEDDQRLKALALQRQLEMKAKVEEARKAMNALKDDDTIVDGRTLYTNVTERVYRYNYDTGQLKTSFVSREGWDDMPRRVEVFRDTYTSFDNVEMLNMLMYEANTDRRDLDDEELRLVLNKEYTEMKSDAECEILYRCRMTAGNHVWDAKKNYVYPLGFTSWELALDVEQLQKEERAGQEALLPAFDGPSSSGKPRNNDHSSPSLEQRPQMGRSPSRSSSRNSGGGNPSRAASAKSERGVTGRSPSGAERKVGKAPTAQPSKSARLPAAAAILAKLKGSTGARGAKEDAVTGRQALRSDTNVKGGVSASPSAALSDSSSGRSSRGSHAGDATIATATSGGPDATAGEKSSSNGQRNLQSPSIERGSVQSYGSKEGGPVPVGMQSKDRDGEKTRSDGHDAQGRGGSFAPAAGAGPSCDGLTAIPVTSITENTLLSVTLHRASRLARADTFGLSDPYTIVNLVRMRERGHDGDSDDYNTSETSPDSATPSGQTTVEAVRRELHRSQIVKTSLDPVWEERVGPVPLHSLLFAPSSPSHDEGGREKTGEDAADMKGESPRREPSAPLSPPIQPNPSSLYLIFDLYDYNRINHHDYLGSARVSLGSVLSSLSSEVHLSLPVGTVKDHNWTYDGRGTDFSSKSEENGATVSVTISLSESGGIRGDTNTVPSLGGAFSAFQPPLDRDPPDLAVDANGAPLLLSSPPLHLGPKYTQTGEAPLSLPRRAEAKLETPVGAEDEMSSDVEGMTTPLKAEEDVDKDNIAEILEPFLGRAIDIDLHVELKFTLQSCTGLARADTLGSSDPYVTISSIPTTDATLQYYFGTTAEPTESVIATESIKGQVLGESFPKQREVDGENNAESGSLSPSDAFPVMRNNSGTSVNSNYSATTAATSAQEEKASTAVASRDEKEGSFSSSSPSGADLLSMVTSKDTEPYLSYSEKELWKSSHKDNTLSPSWDDEMVTLDLATITIREATSPTPAQEDVDEQDGERKSHNCPTPSPPPLSYYRKMFPLLRVEVYDYNRLTTGKFLGGAIVPPRVYMKATSGGATGSRFFTEDGDMDKVDDGDIISLGSLRERGASRDDDDYSTVDTDAKIALASMEIKADMKDGCTGAIDCAKLDSRDDAKGSGRPAQPGSGAVPTVLKLGELLLPPSPADLAASALMAKSSAGGSGVDLTSLAPVVSIDEDNQAKLFDQAPHEDKQASVMEKSLVSRNIATEASNVGRAGEDTSPRPSIPVRSFSHPSSKDSRKRTKKHNEYNVLACSTVKSGGTLTCLMVASVQTTFEISREQSQRQEKQYLAELGDAVPSWLRYHEDKDAQSKLAEVAKAEADGVVDVHRMLYLYRKVVMGLDDKDQGRIRSTAGQSLSVEIMRMREPRLQFSILHALNLAPTPMGGTTAGVIVPGSNASRSEEMKRPPHLSYIGSNSATIKAADKNFNIKPYAVIWLNEFKEAPVEASENEVVVQQEGDGDGGHGQKAAKRSKKLRKLTEEELSRRAHTRALEKTKTKPFYKTKLATVRASVVASKGGANATSGVSPYGPVSGSPSSGDTANTDPIFNESTFSIDLRGIKARALHHLYRHTRLLRGLRRHKSTEVTAAAERAQAAFDDALKATKLRALPSLHIELWDGNEKNKDKKSGKAPFLGCVDVPATSYLSNNPVLEGQGLALDDSARQKKAEKKTNVLTKTVGSNLDYFNLQKVVCLEIVVRGCEKLPAADHNGLSDPYVKVFWKGRYLGQTPVLKKTLNPRWTKNNTGGNSFRLYCEHPAVGSSAAMANKLRFEVWDKDTFNADDKIAGLDLTRKPLLAFLATYAKNEPRPDLPDGPTDLDMHGEVFDLEDPEKKEKDAEELRLKLLKEEEDKKEHARRAALPAHELRELIKQERLEEEKARREAQKASSNPFAKQEEVEWVEVKKFGKIDVCIRMVACPLPAAPPQPIGAPVSDAFPRSGPAEVLGDTCAERRLFEKLKKDKAVKKALLEKNHLRALGLGEEEGEEGEEDDEIERDPDDFEHYQYSPTTTVTETATVSKQQYTSSCQRFDEATRKGPHVYYTGTQTYLLEESAALSDEENVNATGGALTVGAMVYDAYPLAEHVVQAAAAREEQIAKFEAAARKCRPRCSNKGYKSIVLARGVADGAPLWPTQKEGEDSGCELCHNEYDNVKNECPLAIRERILFLREREQLRQCKLVGDGDGDGDGGAKGSLDDLEEEEEEALAAFALIPKPAGYDGGSHIYRANDPLPPIPPPVPALIAAHSQHQNEEFPFNFGIRLRRSDPSHPRFHDTIYFHCLASDKCRACNINKARSGTAYHESGIIEYNCTPIEPTKPVNYLKGTKAGVPIIAYKRPFVDLICEHLEKHHWNMLVQFSFMKKGVLEKKLDGLDLDMDVDSD